MNATSLADGFGRNLTSFDRAGSYLSGTKEFLNSNSAVAKFSFLLLVIILFVFLLRVGTQLLAWYFTPTGTPFLLDGLKSATKPLVVSADPSKINSKPIIRSKNEDEGLEFSYSIWLNIENLITNAGQYKHIFHKGNSGIQTSGELNGVNMPNNAPGLYLHPTKNSLVIFMDTFESMGERIEVDNIPLSKWICVVLRVTGKNVDVYINGTLVHRHILKDVPKQNYGDVFINMNNGFSGFVSSLRYYNYGLSVSEISSIVQAGPKLTADESLNSFPPYFSLSWYLNQ